MQRDFKGGNDVPVLVVFERNGGLSTADLNTIGKLGEGLERLGLSGATPVFAPFSKQTRQPLGELTRVARGVGPISRDGEAALVALAIDAEDRGAVVHGVKKIRAYLAAHADPGLHSYVTGPGGVAADLEQVAEDAGQTLLIATLSLVLLLLLLVYRAPLLALMPLLVVGIAYLIAIGLTYLLIESGAIIVNTEGTFLLLVLIFGAGTDYSLLLIHRYREELGAGGEPLAALRDGARRERAADRRLGGDGDRGDAGPAARRPRVDPLARPGAGDRDRGDALRRRSPCCPPCSRSSGRAPSGRGGLATSR